MAIRRGERPGWAMTYGPGPAAYRTMGHSYFLLWKGRGGGEGWKKIKRGEMAGEGQRVHGTGGVMLWRQCRHTSLILAIGDP